MEIYSKVLPNKKFSVWNSLERILFYLVTQVAFIRVKTYYRFKRECMCI